MTRIQILKDDLTKAQIRTILDVENDERWADWTVYDSEEYIIGETENEEADDMMLFLIDEMEIDENLIEVD